MFVLCIPWLYIVFIFFCMVLWSSMVIAGAVPVELRQTETGWQLTRGGEPYFIRGAGGDGSLQQLAAAGGNSVRTWGGDDIDSLLDEAHALVLSSIKTGFVVGLSGQATGVTVYLDSIRFVRLSDKNTINPDGNKNDEQ